MTKESLERLDKLIEFSKYGFRGILIAGISGMILVILLAVLDAFTEFKITSNALVAITFIVAMGAVAFGYFSLRKIPTIDFKIKEGEIELSVTEARRR